MRTRSAQQHPRQHGGVPYSWTREEPWPDQLPLPLTALTAASTRQYRRSTLATCRLRDAFAQPLTRSLAGEEGGGGEESWGGAWTRGRGRAAAEGFIIRGPSSQGAPLRGRRLESACYLPTAEPALACESSALAYSPCRQGARFRLSPQGRPPDLGRESPRRRPRQRARGGGRANKRAGA